MSILLYDAYFIIYDVEPFKLPAAFQANPLALIYVRNTNKCLHFIKHQPDYKYIVFVLKHLLH